MRFLILQDVLDFFNHAHYDALENTTLFSTHLAHINLWYITNQQFLSSPNVGQSIRIKCQQISLLKNGKKEIIHKFLTVGEEEIFVTWNIKLKFRSNYFMFL